MPTARCPHFGTCGGCAFQDKEYGRHLAAKNEAAARAFAEAGVPALFALPIGAAEPERWFYRNRMSFVVGPGPAIGLRERGRWDAIVDLGTCFVLSEEGHALVNAFRDFVRERGLVPYDLRAERGEVRYLVVREGKNTGHRLALAVTRTREFPFDDFARFALERGCTAAAHAVNPAPSDVSTGEIAGFAGAPLEERVGRTSFEIGPTSFFQPSTRLAERLVDLAGSLIAGGRALVDLYCGGGLFALTLADRFARVVGIESESCSACDAVKNVARNGAANVTIIEGDVEAALAGVDADRAIVDPPRGGLRPAAIRAVVASQITQLIYVSCNPASMARDIAALAGSFRLDSPVQVIDSLPWTSHVEAVARLVRA